MEMQYDVIIVGGAMTGITQALALNHFSQGQLNIAVLEKQAPNQHQQGGFDARCIALSDGSCRRFAQISSGKQADLWQQLAAVSTPIQKIHVSDQGHCGLVQFDATEFHLAQLGAVIELDKAGKILLQACENSDNIDYFAPVQIAQIQRFSSHIQVQLQNGDRLTAALVIGADGVPSSVATATQMEQKVVRDYQQSALITNLLVQQPHQNCAFERFTPQGPLALLPMQDNLMSMVWCVKDPQALMAMNDADFLHSLQQQFGWRLGKLQQCGKRFVYPLKLYQATQHIQWRAALVGNAAQTLHPIAGQGFNLGIRDAMTLAAVVAEQHKMQQDIGEYASLVAYQQRRQQDQQRMMRFTDGLLSLFTHQLLPLQVGRNLGLLTLSHASLLRQHFAKPTLGWV